MLGNFYWFTFACCQILGYFLCCANQPVVTQETIHQHTQWVHAYFIWENHLINYTYFNKGWMHTHPPNYAYHFINNMVDYILFWPIYFCGFLNHFRYQTKVSKKMATIFYNNNNNNIIPKYIEQILSVWFQYFDYIMLFKAILIQCLSKCPGEYL